MLYQHEATPAGVALRHFHRHEFLMRWDIFCRVIDNYGDAGVCWRLAADLAARGETVRLWMDEAAILQWLAPYPQSAGVELADWRLAGQPLHAAPDVLVEAFGCEIPGAYLQNLHSLLCGRQPVWLNLEYLSAENYVERMHGLPSPVMVGPAQGWQKHFFYPGFTAGTGGLLRERDLPQRQREFQPEPWRRTLLERAGLPQQANGQWQSAQWLSLFSYEAACLPRWLRHLAEGPARSVLLVAAGRSQKAFEQALTAVPGGEPPPAQGIKAPGPGIRSVVFGHCAALLLPFMPQTAFDEILWASDFNIVRGEDSLVRALWAGKPFIWHIYPQHDNAHHAKLNAFLDRAHAPRPVREAFHVWNGMADSAMWDGQLPRAAEQPLWQAFASECRERLLAQADLVSQLLSFVRQRQPA